MSTGLINEQQEQQKDKYSFSFDGQCQSLPLCLAAREPCQCLRKGVQGR